MSASNIAVTVIGQDQPGIIAGATAGLASAGLNLEDSTMTRLRGHFAMMLICSGDRSPAEVEQALAPLAAGGRLQVSAWSVPADEPTPAPGLPFVLTVHGGDRPGIVSAVTSVVANSGGNVTDLTTRLTGDLYVVVAEVDLPTEADAAAVDAQLRETARDLGVDVTLRPQEPDVL